MRRTVAVISSIALTVAASLAVAGPASAAPSLRFHGAQYDSPGADKPVTNGKLNAEWISLVNSGKSAVKLKGYTVRDKAGHVYTFGDVRIAGKGGRFWLKTGTGKATARTVYWGLDNYVWNNTGDTATLKKPNGTTVDTCSWKYKKGRTWVGC
jgi:hypothetical protein